MSVVLGLAQGRKVVLDVDVLLRTRLLVQANSGAGKSWLLRRLAEQLFGAIQVILIDPEGEFATLREKFGYVLVGKGGETPADTRSATLLAHKLLELRASAVCDLYEMKPFDRHRWVRLFLEALIDSPKRLWHPLVVIVDEAHQFSPEKGAGESEASEAMIGLATRGRKRGFCAVFATQRLGKLRKDAASELLNVLVGGTFIDIDRKRAAEALGIPPSDQRAFFDQIKVLEPGRFWALGRAISRERILVAVGAVQTTHPEPGSARHAAEPPPPPEKVRQLLPKLADLPKEAEAKAKTESELRVEIRSLRAQLTARPEQVPTKPVRVEVSVLKDQDVKRLETIINRAADLEDKFKHLSVAIGAEGSRLASAVAMAQSSQARVTVCPPTAAQGRTGQAVRALARAAVRMPRSQSETPEGTRTGPEQRILDAIAWLNTIGIEAPNQVAVAFLAGYSYGGGAFNNPRGRLRTDGLVQYVGTQRIVLTEAGRAVANSQEVALTAEELHRRVLDRLPNPEQRILRPLLEVYPKALSDEDLAARAGYTPGAGAFNNPKSRLRSLGLIDYPSPRHAVALPLLFLEDQT